MSHRIFYYMEIKLPNYTGTDVIGSMKSLLAEHIDVTDSKKSKVANETVYTSTTLHGVVDDVQAVTLEFQNERTYNTYIQATSEFRDWVVSTHNAEYTFEKVTSASYDALSVEFTNTEHGGTETYYENIKKYMTVDLPTQRGFL